MLINRKSSGFTLIELMVVIAIIGLLASIVLVSLSSAKKKSQYTRALQDTRTMQTALELYYDVNGDWPTPGPSSYFIAYSSNSTWNTLGTYLQPYLSQIPVPVYPNNGAYYEVYNYYKGATHKEIRLAIFDSVTNQFVDCVIIDDGYWLDFLLPEQTSLSAQDGGYDPDGIDFAQGNVRSTTDHSQCPLSTVQVVSV